ncbi:MAG TPA: MarR family transcriptional regulator, partial [Anaerolineales bacterium]|nr:MarR family transcriptional regulator [Anaerolineales bacterium]
YDERTDNEPQHGTPTLSSGYYTRAGPTIDRIGVHRAQAAVLCRLFAQDGLTQSEIGDQLSVQGATVTNMLQRMEEAELVTRRRDLEDNRRVRVYPTQPGREQERTITGQFLKLERAVFEGIGDEDRALFRRILNQLLSNMDDLCLFLCRRSGLHGDPR